MIFEEFKGTGNMEVVLDRRLSDRRKWPAIDIGKSGTRKEELLLHPQELEKVFQFIQKGNVLQLHIEHPKIGITPQILEKSTKNQGSRTLFDLPFKQLLQVASIFFPRIQHGMLV